MRAPTLFVLSALSLAVTGCKGSGTAAATTGDSANLAANSSSNNAPANAAPDAPDAPDAPAPAPAGEKVGITTTKPGTGPGAKDGDFLSMRYTGKLTNGEVFDSNAGGKPPFALALGSGQVIKGWEEGLQGIKAGERRTLRIPSAKGYGAQGSPPKIGPNADLVFDVEALAVIPREEQELVKRETLKAGTGAVVKANSRVTFHFVASVVGGDEFENTRTAKKPVTITVGKGEVVRGLDSGLEGMRVGGRYRLFVPPAAGFGAMGSNDGKVPPSSALSFVVEILKVS